MAANIFSITGDEYNSYPDFKNGIRNNNISNALFIPDTFSSAQGYEKYKEITFRSISFKNTTFERIKFIDCHFIGCLFLSVKFIRCDFSNCKFKDCNFLGSSWEKSRINPKQLYANFDFKKDANIATNLFQTLYDQYKKEHQPNYAKMAKYLFMKSKYGLDHYYLQKGTINKFNFFIRRIKNFFHCAMSGYGVYRGRIIASFFAFLFLSACLNHSLQQLIFMTDIAPDIIIENTKIDYSFIQSLYYTFISITTIGFGDMVPKSEIGRILTMIESTIGIVIIAVLLNFSAESE